ncbi:MAG: GGDEF domain-containing protein [Lachnospiraceae bacterium]|nr:GGDEF domain-containing protein [Lachnospiraceae bacterium]
MIFSKRKTIGVFISKMFKVFDEAFFAALERESKRLDYDIVIFTTAGYFLTTSEYDIQESEVFRFAPTDILDGIIAVPSSYEQGEFRDMVYDFLEDRKECPVVIVREESDTTNCVYTDNRTAYAQVIRHLIEDHGLTRICYQSGDPENPEMTPRLEAFKEEMLSHGLTANEDQICYGNLWTTSGHVAYEAFFSDPDKVPQAVACANDFMAMGLIRILREHGYRVPEDVIVAGFDNIRDWCIDIPSLTTIQPDFDGMVTEAMEILDKQIKAGSKKADPVRVPLAGQLIMGESCGCGRRHPDYFRHLSERTMAFIEDCNDQDAAMNNMSIDLGACDNLTELHNVMISKRTGNPIVRDHYICLFGTPEDPMDENSDQACLVHAVRDHRDCGMPMIAFDRKELLPLMAERTEEAQVFYIKLLHQKGHNFGYSVFRYDEGKVPSRCFVQTNVLLSIAMENIYRKNELMALYEERRLSSITDLLTGLLNRRGLMESIEPKWLSMTGRTIAFVCIDLDGLKQINDSFGHAAGDYAIRLVGRAIRDSLPKKCEGARTGGDEFVVFMPEAGPGRAERFVQAFNNKLEELSREGGRSFAVTASAGYAVKKLAAATTIEECIQAGDRVMYEVKEERKKKQ